MNYRLLSSKCLTSRANLLALVSASALLLGQHARATNDTWTGGDPSTDWVAPANWGGTAPTSGQGLIFNAAGANGTTLSNSLTSSAFNVAGIQFSTAAPAYVFNGNTFTLTGAVTNTSTALQTFNNTDGITGLYLNAASTTWAIGGGITITNGLTNSSNAAETITANGTSSGTLTLGGFTLNNGAATVTDIINGSGPVNITGAVVNGGAGPNGLTYGGTGTLTLGGANTYTGATSLTSAGTVILAGSSTGTGATTMSNTGAVLELGTGADGGLASGTVTIAGTIESSDNTARTISNNITFTNGSAVTFGAAQGAGTNLGNLTFTNVGTMNANGAGGYTVNNSTVVTLENGSFTSNALNKNGTGELVLQNIAVNNGGIFTINAGTVQLAGTTNLETNNGNTLVVNSGGTLDLNGTSQVTKSLGGTAGGVILNNNSGTTSTLTIGNVNTASATYNGTIVDNNNSGTGQMAVAVNLGSGNTETFTGSNTYSGATTLTTGTLVVTSLANGGVASGIGQSSNAASNLIFGTGGLAYAGASSASTDRLFTIGASGSNATILANDSTPANTLTFSNTGTIAFTGAAGTHTLTLGGSNTGVNVFNPVLTDSGGTTTLAVNSSVQGGTWALGGANTFSGGTTISSVATVQLNNSLALQNSVVTDSSASTGSALTFNAGLGSATIQGLAGTPTGSANIALTDTGSSAVTLNIGTLYNTNTNSYGGTLSGLGGITVFGINNQTFTGNNTYSGTTTINYSNLGSTTPGVLKSTDATVSGGTPFGTGAINFNGGTLTIAPSGSGGAITDTVASGASGTLFTYGGGDILNVAKGTNTSVKVTIGGGGAVLNRTNNGVLIINPGATGDLGTTEQVLINGTAPTTTGPLSSVNASIVGQGATTANMGDFLTYSATNGFQTVTGETSRTATTVAASTMSGSEITNVGAGTTIIGGNNTTGGMVVQSGATVTMAANTTLTIGDNTAGHQAGLILNGGSVTGSATIGSVLNFGQDEGIIYDFNGNSTISAQIAGSGGITLAGKGQTLSLNNLYNTFTGNLTVDTGVTLALPGNNGNSTTNFNDNSLGAFNDSTVLNGGAITDSGRFIGLGRSLVLTSEGGTLSGNSNWAFDISGSGALTIGGSTRNAILSNNFNFGTFLSGNNTYTGGTILYAEWTSIASLNALGASTSTITFDGGSLDIAGNSVTNFGSHTVVFDPGTTFNLGIESATNTFTLGQPITIEGGSFGKWGAGTLRLTGASNYTTQTQVYGGTLLVDESAGGSLYAGNTGVSGTGAAGGLYFDGGTVDVLGASTGTTTQNFGNINEGLNNATSSTTSAGGMLIGDNNGGTLNINLNTIAMTVSTAGTAGAPLLQNGSQTGDAFAIVAKGTGTTTFTTTTAPDGTPGGNGVYGGRVVYLTENSSGAITGANWATSNSVSGTFTLSAYNSYINFNVDNGSDSNDNNLISTQGNLTLFGQTTDNSLKIANTANRTLDIAGSNLNFADGGLLFTGSANYTITDSVGGGNITSGMTGTAQTTGGTNAGTDLVIQNYGTGTLNINAPITNSLNSGGNLAASTLTIAGVGTTVLSAANTYTGRTFIEGGVVSVSSDAAFGGANGSVIGISTSAATPTIVTSTATSLPSGFGPGVGFLGQTVNTITGSSGAWIITLSGNANTTLINGTADFSNAQQVYVGGGTVQATSNVAFSENNTTGLATSTGTYRNFVIGGAGATFDVTNGSTMYLQNVSSLDPGAPSPNAGATLNITSSDNSHGTVILGYHPGSNAGHNITGGINITNATLRFYTGQSTYASAQDTGALGSAAYSYVTLNGSGDLSMGGSSSVWVGGLNSTSASSILENGVGTTTNVTFGVINGDNETFAGDIENTSTIGSGNLSFVKAGGGSMTFSGVNTYTGATVDFDGALIAGSTHAFSAGSDFILYNNADVVLNLNGFSNTIGSLSGGGTTGGNVALGSTGATLTTGYDNTGSTYSGVISGTGNLTKIGTGNQTLTTAESYSGTTTVNNGGLVTTSPSSGSPLGTGAVTINGGTLYLAPTSGSAAYTGASAAGAQLTYGGNATLGLTTLNGSATSLTYTVGSGSGSAFNRTNNGDLILQVDPVVTNPGTTTATYSTSPTATNALGSTELVKVASGNTTPTVTNGMVSPTIVGSLGGMNTNLSNLTISNASTSGSTVTSTMAFLPQSLTVGSTMMGQQVTGITGQPGQWTIQLAGSPNAGATNTTVGYLAASSPSNLTLTGVTSATNSTSVTVTSSTLPSSFGIGATLFGQTVTGISGSAGAWTITLSGNANVANTADQATYTTPSVGTFLTYGANGFTTIAAGSYTTTSGAITSTLPTDEIANVSSAATFSGSSNQVYALAVQKGVTTTITGVTLQVGDNNGSQAGVILNGGTISGTGTLNFGTDEGIIYGFNSTSTLTAAIAGSGGVTFGGSQAIALGTANTYSGVTTVNGITLNLTALGNGGLASDSLGTASNAAGNLVLNGGTLAITPTTTDTTNRLFTIGSGGATILSNSGTGTDTVSFTNTGAIAVSGNYGNVTLTLGGTNTGTNTFAPVLADASVGNTTSLIKTGTGLWALAGANTYTGGTTISAGTLQINTGGNLGSGGVNDLGTLTYNQAGTLTESNIINGSGALNQTGTGTTVLAAANSISGATTVSAGVLQLGNANALYNSALTVNVNGGLAFSPGIGLAASSNGGLSTQGVFDVKTLAGTGNILLQDTSGGAVYLDIGGPLMDANTNGTTSYSGTLSGSGGIIISSYAGFNSKTLNLTAAGSSYTGFTEIDGPNPLNTTATLGATVLANGGSNSSIGASSNAASNLVFGGGVLQFNGTVTGTTSTDRLFTIGDEWGSSATINASGTGALAFTNTGAIALGSSANSVVMGVVSNRTLTLGGTNTGNNVFAPLLVDASTQAFTNLVKANAGTWDITNTGNTYSGPTNLDGGILNVASLATEGALGGTASSIGSSSNSATNLFFNGGTLQYTGATTQTTDRLFMIGDASGSGNTATLDASGTGGAALVFNNTGFIGEYASENGNSLLTLTGTTTGTNTLAAIYTDSNVAGKISALTKTGSDIWDLTSTSNSYSGTTTIDGGILNVASVANGGVVPATATGTSGTNSLTVSSNTGLAVGQVVTGKGIAQGATITNISGTTITLSINNVGTVAGATFGSGNTLGISTNVAANLVINNGTLQYSGSTAQTTDRLFTIGDATNTLTNAATLDASGTGAGTLSFTNTGAVAFANPNIAHALILTGSNTGNNTFASLLANSTGTTTGTTTLTKNGAGTWVVSGANTFTGAVTINNGVLSVGTVAAVGSAQPLGENNTVTLNGASAGAVSTLRYTGGSATLAQNVTVTTGDFGTISNTGGGLLTLSGTLSKNGSVLNLSSGKIEVTGTITGTNSGSDLNVIAGASVGLTTANTYNGPTSVSGSSTLLTGVAGALPSGTLTNLTLGATGDSATDTNVVDLLGTNQSVASLTVASGSTATNEVVSSNGSAATATEGSGASSATGTLTVVAAGTDTYTGVIGAGTQTNLALSMTGAGSLTLTGNNTYTGGTTVVNGQLFVNNTVGSGAGTGKLTVNAGTTFGGTGSYGTTGTPGSNFNVIGTGTTTALRANVLVGMASASDTNTTATLGMIAATGTISNANLTFNINSGVGGGLGTDPANSGTELNIGGTLLTFSGGTQSTTLTLNIQGLNVIGGSTPYVLIAGTTGAVDQYSGLSLGTGVGNIATGLLTPILNSGAGQSGDLTLALTGLGGLANTWYGAHSYLFLYQNSTTGADDIEVEVVPEPGTWALMLGGLAMLVFWQRSRRKSKV